MQVTLFQAARITSGKQFSNRKCNSFESKYFKIQSLLSTVSSKGKKKLTNVKESDYST